LVLELIFFATRTCLQDVEQHMFPLDVDVVKKIPYSQRGFLLMELS
jgi:hypothetical protein